MIHSELWVVLVAAGVPSAIVAWFFTRLNKKMDKRQEERERRETTTIRYEGHMIELMMANINLAIATAEAVQRIPDAHCNGDMSKALERVEQAKADFRKFEKELTANTVRV